MKLGQFEASFAWGLLLITDDCSTEEIPRWRSNEDQVTTAGSAMVVRVLHRDEGSVAVDLWTGSGDVRGGLSFRGDLDVPSGVLRLSDATAEQSLRVPVEARQHIVEIYTDAAREATRVSVLLDPRD